MGSTVIDRTLIELKVLTVNKTQLFPRNSSSTYSLNKYLLYVDIQTGVSLYVQDTGWPETGGLVTLWLLSCWRPPSPVC